MKEVISFLDDTNARGQALQIILGFTAEQEQRAVFLKLDLVKRLLRLVLEKDKNL